MQALPFEMARISLLDRRNKPFPQPEQEVVKYADNVANASWLHAHAASSQTCLKKSKQ